jgi:enamine deaminase RidA (YjgF/YER057c/UK114 family)
MGFKEQLSSVLAQYANAIAAAGLPPESAIFCRIHLSDVINQRALLQEPAIEQILGPTAISVVGQPPASGAKIALLAYHLADRNRVVKHRPCAQHLLVEHGGVRHLWATQLCAEANHHPADAGEQTRRIFERLIDILAKSGAALKDNCLRTWLYLKDVDVFYPDMVTARRNVFEDEGLTADTHYIASTGIEGACAHRFDLVSMDAYSVLGVKQQQITYLNSLSQLCHTHTQIRGHFRARNASCLCGSRASVHLRNCSHRFGRSGGSPWRCHPPVATCADKR